MIERFQYLYQFKINFTSFGNTIVVCTTRLLFVDENSNAGIIVIKCAYQQFTILKRSEFTLKFKFKENPMKFVRIQSFLACGTRKAHESYMKKIPLHKKNGMDHYLIEYYFVYLIFIIGINNNFSYLIFFFVY